MPDNQLFAVQPVLSQHIIDGITLYVYNKQSLNELEKDNSILLYEKLADQLNLNNFTSVYAASNLNTFLQADYIRALGSCLLQYKDSINFEQQTIFLVINKHQLSPGFFIPPISN